MKVLFLLLIIFTNGGYSSFGQSMPKYPILKEKIAIVSLKQPLLVIGLQETNYHSLLLDPNNLQILKTYTDSLELVPFGEKGKDGIILAALKTEIPLLRFEEVLDYYKIAAEYRALKVLVDGKFINPDLFLADVNYIKSVQVRKQDVTSAMRYSWNNDELFLYIATVQH